MTSGLSIAGPLLAAVVGSSSGTAHPITAAELFAFCRSPELAEAIGAADALGWARQDDARLAEWRSAMVRDGGSVRAAAWSRDADDRADTLAFWTVEGADTYHACSFTTWASPAALANVVRATFSAPDASYTTEVSEVASWKSGNVEVSYSRVGGTSLITLFTHPR